MKLYTVILLLFCDSYSIYTLSINTIGEKEFPTGLMDMFASYGDEATQQFLGKDILGRDIIEIVSRYGNKYIYAIHTDKSGMRWQIFKDTDAKLEVPFVNLIDKNGAIVHYHPDTLKELFLDQLISEKNVLYPPDDLPLLGEYIVDVSTSIESEIDGIDGVMMMNDTIDEYLPDISTTPILSSEDTVWWPYMAIGSAILLGASVIYYLSTNVATGFRYLRRTDLWSAWRPEESYEALLMVEPSYLVDSLMEAITFKYYPDDNPAARFFEDVQQEYDELLQWMQFRNRIWLSPGGAFDVLEQRLQLLDHMRKVVSYWQAQQIIKHASQ